MREEGGAGGGEGGQCGTCGYYLKNIIKFLISHIGLVSLVIGYTIVGAFIFESLEAKHEKAVKANMSAVRLKVTDDLWNITKNHIVLNETKWSLSVRERLKTFETSLIRAIKTDGWDGDESLDTQQWTFAGALFYSIILITTIGYGHIAPKTDWGKVVTIFYAIPGVPLMMLCLANIGDGMAHSFRFLYWKICCYMCTKRPKKRRRGRSTRSSRRYASTSGSSRTRTSSFRRSKRASDKSADSHLSDSAFYTSSYCDPDYKMEDDNENDMVEADMRTLGGHRHSEHSQNRASQNSRGSDYLAPPAKEDEGRVAVLFNKYALEQEGIQQEDTPRTSNRDRDRDRDRDPDRDPERDGDVRGEREGREARESSSRRSRRDEEDLAITHQPRSSHRSHSQHRSEMTGYNDSPPMMRSPRSSERYQRHLSPPHDPRNRVSRLDEGYYYYDYDDDYEEDEEDEEIVGDKPVPIWLGVMLVVAYIFGGAICFDNLEKWGFLNSVYFCFITLTTIGFGDFVPAQSMKGNVELSIALCSIYLLFGIALLAMSFNLVQEEVINNVKSMARRLGILKEEEEEEELD